MTHDDAAITADHGAGEPELEAGSPDVLGLSPFVHRFETATAKYAYDVNTRRILRLHPSAWDVLEDCGVLADDKIVRKHRMNHSPALVIQALNQIRRFQAEEGLLLSYRPDGIAPFERNAVSRALDSRRQQLILNVTEDCNLRCAYCVYGGGYAGYRRHSAAAMNWPVARKAIDDYMSHNHDAEESMISFYGGEPLLNTELIRRCVDYVKDRYHPRSPRYALTTNGVHLEGTTLGFMAEHEFQISISLDGPQRAHDRNRRDRAGGPTWERVMANVRELILRFPEYVSNGRLRFGCVLTPDSDVLEVQEFWRSEDLFEPTMSVGIERQKARVPGELISSSTYADTIRPLWDDFLASLESGRFGIEAEAKSRWVQNSLFAEPLVLFHKRTLSPGRLPARIRLSSACVPGLRRLFVTAGGKYFACERVPQIREQEIGDVEQGVLVDRAMGILERWTDFTSSECVSCWCVSHCKVGCFASVTAAGGNLTRQAKLNACETYRDRLHRLLVTYCTVLEANPKAFDFAEDVVIS